MDITHSGYYWLDTWVLANAHRTEQNVQAGAP